MDTHILAGDTYKQCVSICLLLVLASTLVALVHAGSGTITITGNVPAVEDSIKIGGSAPSTVDVDTWYLITANISDVDLMNDIARVQVILYDNAIGYLGNLDKERRYGVAWKTSAGNWECLTDSGWGAVDTGYFDTGGSSSWGGIGNPGWGIWTFEFKFDTVSHYTQANGWTINVTATDKAGNQAWRDATFAVNLYQSIVIDSTISWSANPGSNNATATSNPFHITSYKSNAIAKFQIQATDPTNTFGDSFNANNLLIDDDPDPGTGTHCQKLSNDPTDWWTELGVTSIGAENAYWFVSVPAGQPTGTYTFTYTIGIAFDSYADA